MAQASPPPALSSRVVEYGDRIEVVLRPERNRAHVAYALVFGAAWIGLVIWGSAEDFDSNPIGVLLWATFWVGIMVVGLALTFLLETTVIASPYEVVVRRHLGRFTRERRYPATIVRDVRAKDTGDDEGPSAYGLELVLVSGKRRRIADTLTEAEASFLAGLVYEHIHPTPRPRGEWGVRATAPEPRPPLVEREDWTWWKGLFAGAVVLFLLFAGSQVMFGGPGRDVRRPADHVNGEDAATLTFFALRRQGLVLTEAPRCASTATGWSCTVVARAAANGPSTPRTYVCTAGSSRSAEAVECGRLAGG